MGARPLASLSANLLARPGHAKPAMRPQAFAPQPHDDLGWNDMGHAPTVQPTPIAAPVTPAVTAPVPPVLVERQELERAVAPTPARTKRPAVSADTAARRAAFTLRLDADRHLRLRLASAVAGRSSQRLVIEALDAFLNALPQVEKLARQVPAQSSAVSGEKK